MKFVENQSLKKKSNLRQQANYYWKVFYNTLMKNGCHNFIL